MKQAQVLSKLMEEAGLRLPDKSAASQYTGLSPERLNSARLQIVQRLERAFSEATAASAEAPQPWAGFQTELRQLGTLTLLMAGHLTKR